MTSADRKAPNVVLEENYEDEFIYLDHKHIPSLEHCLGELEPPSRFTQGVQKGKYLAGIIQPGVRVAMGTASTTAGIFVGFTMKICLYTVCEVPTSCSAFVQGIKSTFK